MASLVAPVRVSPLIKFARWTLLGSGILYGVFHQSRLSKRENKRREAEVKVIAERNAKLAIEKKLAAEKEWEELQAMFQPPK